MKRSSLILAVAAMVLAGCGANDSTTGSSYPGAAATSAPNDGASSAAKSSSIPTSAVIDNLLKSSDPKRFDLVAKCNFLVATVLASGLNLSSDAEVKESLASLVTVARQYEAAVADALAKDPKAASDWCKSTGMAN